MVISEAGVELEAPERKSYGSSAPGRPLPSDHGQRSVDGQERAKAQGKFIGRPRGSKNKRK